MHEIGSAPIFILGLHRSGTTLLYQMLAASGCFRVLKALHVIAFEELCGNPLRWEGLRQEVGTSLQRQGVNGRVVDHVSLDPDTLEEYGFILNNLGLGWTIKQRNLHVLDRVVELLRRTPSGSGRPLLKNPWDFSRGHLIHRMIPEAKLIYIHRNPLHVLSSTHRTIATIMTRSNPYLASLCEAYRKFESSEFPRAAATAIGRRFPGAAATAIIECSAHWVRGYLKTREKISPAARLDVRFEDVCARPNETLDAILRFLGVDAPSRDYAGMIGPHASTVVPHIERRSARVRARLGKYASWAGYDLNGWS